MTIAIESEVADDSYFELFINAVMQVFTPEDNIRFLAADGCYFASVELKDRDIHFGSTRFLLEDATEEQIYQDVKDSIEIMKTDERFL